MNKRSKYGNKKIEADGLKFDSKKEYNRYLQLKLFEQTGHIEDLKTQVKYVLIPSQKDENGRVIEKECYYKADFVYYDCDSDTRIVEDVKGKKTKEYIIKRKLMLKVHGIRIQEI